MDELVIAIKDYGFPIVAMTGLAYFVYFVWNVINEKIDPAIEELHMTLIRLIDQVRMLPRGSTHFSYFPSPIHYLLRSGQSSWTNVAVPAH